MIWTSVFGDGPGGGNPCPVIFDADGWPTERMQATAAELGHETAFVLPPADGGDVRLRYFAPRHEMEMCVHATVAAVVLLARVSRLAANPVAVETPLGVRSVAWHESSAMVEQFPPQFADPVRPDRAFAALRLAPEALADLGPIQSVSTSRPKLMVPLRDEATLAGLSPDFPLLWEVCDELAVTGRYPFTVTVPDAVRHRAGTGHGPAVPHQRRG